jgi:hypothetical protein
MLQVNCPILHDVGLTPPLAILEPYTLTISRVSTALRLSSTIAIATFRKNQQRFSKICELSHKSSFKVNFAVLQEL